MHGIIFLTFGTGVQQLPNMYGFTVLFLILIIVSLDFQNFRDRSCHAPHCSMQCTMLGVNKIMSKIADIVLQSNCVFTAAGAAPFAGYVAVADGKILEVGAGACPKGLIGSETQVCDLGDRTVTPGFSDVHCFFTGYSIGFVGADLSAAKTPAELVSLAKAYAETIPADRPVLCHGWDTETIHPEGTAELDAAFGTRPVILFAVGCETCWMNQAALDTYQFTPAECYPEAYWRLLPDILGNRDFIVPMFRDYMKMMNSRGVTSVKEMGFDQFYGFTDVLADLEKAGELTLRVNFMSQPCGEGANIDYGKRMREKFQGEFVRFSGYNRMTDGSISQLCGELKKPYLCADTTCAQDIDWNMITEEAHAVDDAGFRFSLHAQGDAAICKVIDIYDTCRKDENGKLLNRHAITDLEFSDPADLERMGKLGVIAEVYPQIQSIADAESKIAMIKEKIGMDRGRYYWNRRKMIDSGVPVSCGTDLPLCIDDIPQSVYHCVGGYFPEGGEPFSKQNMLTVPELLTAWTKGGAYNLGCEEKRGTLEAGKQADIAVLSGDIFTTPVEDARSLCVDLTLVGGKIVHSNL